MRRHLIAFLIVLALVACVSKEEQRAEDMRTCEGYGFKPDTNGMADCLMKVDQARQRQFDADADAEMEEDDIMLMGPGCCW